MTEQLLQVHLASAHAAPRARLRARVRRVRAALARRRAPQAWVRAPRVLVPLAQEPALASRWCRARRSWRSAGSAGWRAVPAPPLDRRQSETALAIARGTARLLRSLGFSCISELPLPSGRRADLVALNEKGEIWIVEIKSSVEDLRADQKWQDYRMHCDRLFFAFTQDLPCEIFPQDTGLIIADAYGAHLHCEAPEHRLPAATRKSMTVRFAMAAAQRINRLVDPQGHGEF